MGKRSSDSDSSLSNGSKRKRKSKKAKSGSCSPKRKVCKKKMKKYKSNDKSPTRNKKRDEGSKRYRDSRSPSRRRRYSRSRSRSKGRKYESSSSRSERHRDRKKLPKKATRSDSSSLSSTSSLSSDSYRKRSSSKRSRSKSPVKTRKFEYDADELLMKLNKAAIEAMSANKKLVDPVSSLELQIKRQDIINQIKSDGFTAQPFISGAGTVPEVAPAVDSGTKSNPHCLQDQPTTETKPKPESLLHENFLLESEEDKLSRWVKKLYQIRQRAMNGDSIML